MATRILSKYPIHPPQFSDEKQTNKQKTHPNGWSNYLKVPGLVHGSFRVMAEAQHPFHVTSLLNLPEQLFEDLPCHSPDA